MLVELKRWLSGKSTCWILSSILNIYTGWLTTTCHSRSKRSNTLFWLPRTLAHTHTHTHTHAYTYTYTYTHTTTHRYTPHTHTLTHSHTCIHIHIHLHTHNHTQIHTTHTHTHTHTPHTHTHILTLTHHTHIHTHTCTHKPELERKPFLCDDTHRGSGEQDDLGEPRFRLQCQEVQACQMWQRLAIAHYGGGGGCAHQWLRCAKPAFKTGMITES